MTGRNILCMIYIDKLLCKHPYLLQQAAGMAITQSKVGIPQEFPATHDGSRICVVVSTPEGYHT